MKNRINRFKSTCYNRIKFVILISMLCPLTIGQMWAGTKRIYCEYSAVSSWWGNDGRTATPYVYAWGGAEGAKKYSATATGTANLVYYEINDDHTDLLFYRSSSEDGSWDNQSVDINISSNNRWSISSNTDNGKQKITNQQRYAPGTAIDGLLDIKNPHNQMFSNGTFSATLEAHKTYEFKILETSTLYGLNDLIATSSISNQTLNTSGYQVRLCTAGAGTYTFTYNSSTHTLSIAYPATLHPSLDYCYVIDYSWSPSANLHLWNGTSTKVAEWNGESTIAGSTWPGAAISNKTTINGQSYFYIAPGEFSDFMVSRNGDGNDRTGEIQPSDGYGKRRYWKDASDGWIWDTFTVRIQLNDLSATTAVDPTYKDVAFNSDVLTDLTSVPAKTHYDFGGFYTGYDEVNDVATGTQVINSDGEWIASIADYTDASKHWIHAGTSTTLYAKWTEIKHDVTVAVSPAGAGSVQVSGSPITSVENIGYETQSAEMTPIAAAGWKFKEWRATSNVQMDLLNYHSDYQSGTANKMRINATDDDQTITAVFEPRYYLVGGEITGPDDGGSGTSSGMPGWTNYTDTFKIISNSPSLLATCSLTLGTNKNFYIMVRDKVDGYSYGKSSGTLGDNMTISFVDQDNKVLFYSNGGTEYTFKITAVDGSGRPTVSVERPYQVNVGRKRVDIDGNDHDDNTGGTVAMSKTSGGDAVANGAWVPYGTSVKYDASAESGYSLAWFTASDYATQFTTDPYWYHIATSTGNGYAKFTETSTSVTLANDGHGKVQISSTDKTSTTCGVTTTRSLTAVPNDGYYFTGWTMTSGADYNISSTSANPTTLSGRGSGASSGQTLTANFALRYSIKGTMNSENWGTDHFISNFETVGGKVIGYVEMTLSANTSYEFAIYDLANSEWLKSGSNQVYYMTNGNSYVWDFATNKSYNCGITTAGAGTYRFLWNITDKTMSVIYPNFIIYRSGDKAEDPRATGDDVESYAGGTISQAIEFRMKVRDLDMWYTLCLPFTVSAVKVWETDRYYDLVPFYRPVVGGTFYTGDYIIRTPKQSTDLPIEEFGDWRDPTSPTGYVPSKNTPYIIQWHDSYFAEEGGRYISFFGATGQSISTFSVGTPPSSDNVVNVCVNGSMTTGSMTGAYMLEGDYGNGAWLRLDNASASRPIPPFECYLLVNNPTRARYMAIRPGMTAADTPTGWDDVVNSEIKTHIIVYSISGVCLTQYSNCSINEAGQRLSESYGEGLYILRADNESVKLMVGGK